MDTTTRAADDLLSAALLLAPTSKEQEAIVMAFNRTPPEDRVVAMAGLILDGYRHGNWPTA